MRIYIDSSVFGGCFDKEFANISQAFFDTIFDGNIIALISDILVAELAGAPENVREILDRLRETDFEVLEYSSETNSLQQAYIKAGVLTSKYESDALHVAYATIARADSIISWNFKHLVNPTRERAFNGVNIANGYGLISIMTPLDIVKIMEMNNDEDGQDQK